MNKSNIVAKFTIILILVIGGFFFYSPSASAQAVQQCRPGTGIKGVPCEYIVVDCPIPGPYGICIPDTSIFDSEGNLNTEALVLASSALFLGIVFVMNGLHLKKRVK